MIGCFFVWYMESGTSKFAFERASFPHVCVACLKVLNFWGIGVGFWEG